MNIKDNKRHQETLQHIYPAFAALLQDQELNNISVAELCEMANIDRSTFYAHFDNILALANSFAAEIEKQIAAQPHAEGEFAWIFEYILENTELFRIYFKLDVSQSSSDYKTIFFRKGAYSVAKLWFDDGCKESPEQMGNLVKREYTKLFQ